MAVAERRALLLLPLAGEPRPCSDHSFEVDILEILQKEDGAIKSAPECGFCTGHTAYFRRVPAIDPEWCFLQSTTSRKYQPSSCASAPVSASAILRKKNEMIPQH